MTTLQRKHRLRWVEALESGAYKQGHGKMYDESTDSYCAYGVGHKVAKIAITSTFRVDPKFWDWIGAPRNEFAGLRIGRRRKPWGIMEANDAGKTFAEIAAAMREKWGL